MCTSPSHVLLLPWDDKLPPWSGGVHVIPTQTQVEFCNCPQQWNLVEMRPSDFQGKLTKIIEFPPDCLLGLGTSET